jgi:hypothetical protein
MSANAMNKPASEERVRKFSKRESRQRKAFNKLLQYTENTQWIFNVDSSGKDQETQISTMLIKMIDDKSFFNDILCLIRKERISQRFYNNVLKTAILKNHTIFETADHDAYLQQLANAYLVKEVVDVTSTITKAKRMFAKFQDEEKSVFSKFADLLKQKKIYELLDSQLQMAYAHAKMLNNASTKRYEFFPIDEMLKGQVVDMYRMSVPFGIDTPTETLLSYSFALGQVSQFSKSNHHNKPATPGPSKNTVRVNALEKQSEYYSQKFNRIIAALRKASVVPHTTYVKMMSYINLFKPSDTLMNKKQLRVWMENKLSECNIDYTIDSHHDPVYCKFVLALGNKFQFTVHGTYTFPFSIEGFETASKPKKVVKRSLYELLDDCNALITDTARQLQSAKDKKDELLLAIQESKRQRMDEEAE